MYTGQVVEIPVGQDGLSGNKNFSQIPPSMLLEATNVSFETGTITREGGSTKYNSSAISGSPSIIGGWDWWPNETTQRMVVYTSAGSILKDTGTGTFSTTLRSGVTSTTQVPIFVEGGKEVAANNRKLFIFSGGNPVQVLAADGATTSNITAPPADWSGVNQPTGGCIHENRLWGWGNPNDPHRVYASLVTNHEDFTTTAFSLPIFPGEGEKIVAGLSFKGALVLFKFPFGVYFVDTSNPTNSNWRPVRVTRGSGGAGPGCAVIVDNDVLYIDSNFNAQFLSAAQEYGDLASNNLSTLADMNQFVRDNLNQSRFNLTRGVYYAAKREAHFTCSFLGGTTQNRRLVIDFNKQTPRFRFSDKDTCQSIWLRKDVNNIPRLMSGDNAGFVWRLDQTNKNKDGAAYESRFQTPHTDLSYADPALAVKRKLADYLEIVTQPNATSILYVDVVYDGKIKQTLSFSLGSGNAVFGTGTLFGTAKFGGSRVVNRRKRLTGTFRRISLIIRNGLANQDFSIAKALLFFRPGDERL